MKELPLVDGRKIHGVFELIEGRHMVSHLIIVVKSNFVLFLHDHMLDILEGFLFGLLVYWGGGGKVSSHSHLLGHVVGVETRLGHEEFQPLFLKLGLAFLFFALFEFLLEFFSFLANFVQVTLFLAPIDHHFSVQTAGTKVEFLLDLLTFVEFASFLLLKFELENILK